MTLYYQAIDRLQGVRGSFAPVVAVDDVRSIWTHLEDAASASESQGRVYDPIRHYQTKSTELFIVKAAIDECPGARCLGDELCERYMFLPTGDLLVQRKLRQYDD